MRLSLDPSNKKRVLLFVKKSILWREISKYVNEIDFDLALKTVSLNQQCSTMKQTINRSVRKGIPSTIPRGQILYNTISQIRPGKPKRTLTVFR